MGEGLDRVSTGEKIFLYLKLGRMHFLLAGFALFCMGALYASYIGDTLHIERFIFGYAILALGHLSLNYTNEYFDLDADRFCSPTPVSGGTGILQKYPRFAPMTRTLALLLLAGSLLLAVTYHLCYGQSVPFLLFVIGGNLLGWSYSAPPGRLSYRGWGEIGTAAGFGFFIPGMGYLVVHGSIDTAFLPLSIPLVLFGFFFIVSVEMPDMEADRMAGKWTFVARKGRAWGRWVILFSSLLAPVLFLAFSMLLGSPAREALLMSGAVSLLPLAAGLTGYLDGGTARRPVVRGAVLNIAALTGFCILSDIFLFLGVI
ncbi:MAG: prenyltransferase [Methanomicrobiaceae archaeon]|nr:prenyltransferase [Methanomicrobiaceae archaeon]